MANENKAERETGFTVRKLLLSFIILLALAFAVLLFIYIRGIQSDDNDAQGTPVPTLSPTPTPTPSPTPSPTPTPTPMPTPNAASSTLPETQGIISELNLNGEDIESFTRDIPFDFGGESSYTELEGIITFRGSHWRQGATYGTADVKSKTLSIEWSVSTGSLPKDYGDGSWTGSGWTGQPLIVRWPEATRKIMNLNDEKKAKTGLIEVIYATLDGNIYFLDLADGVKTRKNIRIGVPFKGAGALDPRGYPMIFLGAGDAVPAYNGNSKIQQEFFIYSLIDGSRLYSFGKNSDDFAPRGWHAYDSSALVDAATDTLIEPGENGILYSVKLNTDFDPVAGTLTINPSDMLKFRYTTARSRENNPSTYWLGMEASAAMWHNWLYVSDNCGTLLCIDTNTMKVVWAQDILDDSNSSPVLEEEDGRPVIYTSTSLHWTTKKDGTGTIPIWKIDGLTGEIIWQKDYTCLTVQDISGGVEGSGLLGKNDLSDLVFYPIARTPEVKPGILVALNKYTGEEVWSFKLPRYPWSSPVAVYDSNGNGYIIQCGTDGVMYLLDGRTGELLDSVSLEANIEASPAVFDDMIVVGTRGQKIYGVRIK